MDFFLIYVIVHDDGRARREMIPLRYEFYVFFVGWL